MEAMEQRDRQSRSRLITILIVLGIGGLCLGCCIMAAVVIGYVTLGGEVDFDEEPPGITEPAADVWD